MCFLLVIAMRVLLAVVFLVGVFALDQDNLSSYTYDEYLADFGKTYTDAERAQHEAIFNANLGTLFVLVVVCQKEKNNALLIRTPNSRTYS